ncbi:MAG: serine/threonine protein kinase [Anaerolineae bacterium]|nr:serine/threonine protein kinase [Anaerolineae bacterium]NUQ06301.1 serine/threonine protein kinase [Anaerolineae bacterium]
MKPALIGRQLGDYTLVRLLATGGMSRIYEGVDKRLDRRAAVKVLDLDADSAESEAMKMRFTREARALAKLEHPHVIPIYQYGEQDGFFFIAMKLIEGTDLAQELKELKRQNVYMEPVRALHILEQIAQALDAAHAAQIIHRDVKPSNILIDLNDRATLSDFGLVIQPSVDSTYGTAFGTPRYISPEQATDSSLAVTQSDIYSLGIIVYELLSGQTPFDGKSAMEIALSHINDAPPPPRSINALIPLEVERVVLKALAKDPARRYSSAVEFIAAVRKGYRDAGIVADDTTGLGRTKALPPITPGVRASQDQRRAASRRQMRGGIAAGVVLLTVLALVVILVNLVGRSPGGTVGAAATSAATADSITTALSVLLDDSATAAAGTPATAESSLPMLWQETAAAILLVYDDSALTLVNTSEVELAVTGVELVQGEAQVFNGERIARGVLEAGACFRIRLQERQTDLPDGCERLQAEIAVRDASALFWRDAGSAIGFTLRIDGQTAAHCAAVPRGESRTCRAALAG